jgi:hypothetical protein
MSNIWNTQTFLNSTWLINTVKLKLRDQFEQTWISLIDDSPEANNYKLIKTSFQMEDYFDRKLHLSSTDIWKHNLYTIADNFDSLPQHNFVQNEISLTLTSISS